MAKYPLPPITSSLLPTAKKVGQALASRVNEQKGRNIDPVSTPTRDEPELDDILQSYHGSVPQTRASKPEPENAPHDVPIVERTNRSQCNLAAGALRSMRGK